MAAIEPTSLDHVALWVADRDALADLVCDHLGMHVIERTDRFTLVGADAREGKLTLFTADGPREPGASPPSCSASRRSTRRSPGSRPASLSPARTAWRGWRLPRGCASGW